MLLLIGSISGIGEVVAALVWADNVDQRAELSPNFFDGAWLCRAHEVLELGEELLDWVQVGAIGWQEDQMSPCGPDGTLCAVPLVAAEVIENVDVACGQGRHEHLLDIGCEQFAINWTIDHSGRVDAVVPQGGYEGQRLPMAVRHARIKTLPAQAPAAQRRHVRLDPGFIDEDQAPGVNLILVGLPACALERDVATGLFGRQYGFFEAQPLSMQKKPHRAPTGLDAARGQFRRQPARSERRRRDPRSQPIRTLAAQGARLVTPIWPGVSAPVSRCRLRHLETQEGLIRKAAAIERIVSPASAR